MSFTGHVTTGVVLIIYGVKKSCMGETLNLLTDADSNTIDMKRNNLMGELKNKN